ncbi:Uncharacterised protein [Bordetella pertussis]|nr:Uncharacterised protein [Bordetella pertussis]CFW40078.1 Uncharacterised protein [Bordetella pertussis]
MMRGSSLTWRSLLSCAARSSVSRRESRLLTVSTSVSIAGSSPRSRSVQDGKSVRKSSDMGPGRRAA